MSLASGSVWARRTRQSDGLFDAAVLLTYSLGADGSGTYQSTAGHVDLASTSQTFTTSGVDIGNSNSYELYFGARMPTTSGSGVFLDPQRVLNAANFALGYPLSPGGFVALFGTGFGTQNVTAPRLGSISGFAGRSAGEHQRAAGACLCRLADVDQRCSAVCCYGIHRHGRGDGSTGAFPTPWMCRSRRPAPAFLRGPRTDWATESWDS